MPWTSTIRLDHDKPDVGSASLEWTEDNPGFPGIAGEKMSYGRRVKIALSERDAFIAEAIAARNAWRTRRVSEKEKESNLNTRASQLDV